MSKFYIRLLLSTTPRGTGDGMSGDVGSGGVGGGTVTPATTALPATTSGPSTSAAPATAPSQTAAPVQTATQTPATAPAGFNFRERLKSLNIDSSKFQDDESAFHALADHFRQVQAQQQYAQLGQQVYPQWTEFQKWQEQQKAQLQAEQAKTQQWWTPPEWDPKWLEAVDRDPATGQFIPKMGFAPDIPQKIEAYRAFREQTLQKLTQDPAAAVWPGLEQRVQQVAQQMIQQHLGGYQQQTAIQQVIAQNRSWMVENGQDGKEQLSFAGQIMQKHAEQLESRLKQMGVQGADPNWIFAEAYEKTKGTLLQMQADAAAKQTQTPAPTQTATQQPAAAPAGTNRLQQLSNAGQTQAGVPRTQKRGLGERMMAALAEKGIDNLN